MASPVVGAVMVYTKTNATCTILQVHYDDGEADPYFTIRLDDGSEKQTTAQHLATQPSSGGFSFVKKKPSAFGIGTKKPQPELAGVAPAVPKAFGFIKKPPAAPAAAPEAPYVSPFTDSAMLEPSAAEPAAEAAAPANGFSFVEPKKPAEYKSMFTVDATEDASGSYSSQFAALQDDPSANLSPSGFVAGGDISAAVAAPRVDPVALFQQPLVAAPAAPAPMAAVLAASGDQIELIVTTDGQQYQGVIKAEDAIMVVVSGSDGALQILQKPNIASRSVVMQTEAPKEEAQIPAQQQQFAQPQPHAPGSPKSMNFSSTYSPEEVQQKRENLRTLLKQVQEKSDMTASTVTQVNSTLWQLDENWKQAASSIDTFAEQQIETIRAAQAVLQTQNTEIHQHRSEALKNQQVQLEQALMAARSGCSLVEGALRDADDQALLQFEPDMTSQLQEMLSMGFAAAPCTHAVLSHQAPQHSLNNATAAGALVTESNTAPPIEQPAVLPEMISNNEMVMPCTDAPMMNLFGDTPQQQSNPQMDLSNELDPTNDLYGLTDISSLDIGGLEANDMQPAGAPIEVASSMFGDTSSLVAVPSNLSAKEKAKADKEARKAKRKGRKGSSSMPPITFTKLDQCTADLAAMFEQLWGSLGPGFQPAERQLNCEISSEGLGSMMGLAKLETIADGFADGCVKGYYIGDADSVAVLLEVVACVSTRTFNVTIKAENAELYPLLDVTLSAILQPYMNA